MSNKDVRKPAPGAKEDFEKKRSEPYKHFDWDRKPREDGDFGPDEMFLSTRSAEEHDEWVKAGERIRSQFEGYVECGSGPVDSQEALSCLDVCTRFLTQLVEITSAVIGTTDLRSLRQIFAGDMHVPRNMRVALRAIGVNADELMGREVKAKSDPSPDKNFRKRPRGAKHPLMVLIGFALQATRLIQKITAGTNPDAQNLPIHEEAPEEEDDGSVTFKMPGMPGL